MPASLEDRVTALEDGFANIQGPLAQIPAMNNKLDAALGTINRLASIDQNVTSVLGFVQKHGMKMLMFGAGVMSSLGIGNPHLWNFIENFK